MKISSVVIAFFGLLSQSAFACYLEQDAHEKAVLTQYPDATNVKAAVYSEGWVGMSMPFYVTFESSGKSYVGMVSYNQMTCQLDSVSKFAELAK